MATSGRSPRDVNEKKGDVAQRREIQDLHFRQGLSKKEIARRLGCKIKTVRRWTQSPDQDVTAEKRGWPMHKRRTFPSDLPIRIRTLHEELQQSDEEYFTGATAIELLYRERYGCENVPSLRTIGRTLKALGLSTPPKKGRSKGAAALLCYPEHTIYQVLGRRVAEADFIGPRHLVGRSATLHFLGISFKKEPKLRQYLRVESQTSLELLRACDWFFENFEKPDILKVDNGAAASGSNSGRRTISRFMNAMWKREITPIYSVPRKPFSQASIEGNNSVFSRMYWNQRTFASVAEVDEHLAHFNRSSLRYSRYQRPEVPPPPSEPFVPRAYFLRQVAEHPEDPTSGYISVLNEPIRLPQQYIRYFVLTEWLPLEERLTVYLERENHLQELYETRFEINPNSTYRP